MPVINLIFLSFNSSVNFFEIYPLSPNNSAVCLGLVCHGVLPFSLPYGLIIGLYILSIALVVFALYIDKPKSEVRSFLKGAALAITCLPLFLFVIAVIVSCCAKDGASSDCRHNYMSTHSTSRALVAAAICHKNEGGEPVSYLQDEKTPEVATNKLPEGADTSQGHEELPEGPDAGRRNMPVSDTPSFFETYVKVRAAEAVFESVLGFLVR